MKKANLFFIVLFLGVITEVFSQTTPSTDFFAGKWEIALAGTPMGDVKFTTNLVRKEGKLAGELARADDPTAGKRPITKIEETDKVLKIYFESQQGGEISIDLEKVDDNNLKGKLMDFEATAKRIKD
ncbi:hypothetical protein GVN20_18245 [Runella sp. CRIBMP]|uniref:hypothetical protein n=1 Tax=Runella sp. CRIBMP TaxID=2683261 RepID=UPI0014133649|nr:hypothetical protein [Runella sp. CRIBMP]NBB21312.1 hypothetical protein [Runella sp. CRIBMP]